MTLTAAGEVYKEYVFEDLRLEQKLKKSLEDIQNNKFSTIKLGISQQLEGSFLCKYLSKYIKENNVKFDIKNYHIEELENSIQSSSCDIGFSFIPEKWDKKNELTYEFLKKESIILVTNKNNPLLNGRKSSIDSPISVSFNDVKDQIFVLPNKNSCVVRDIVDGFFNENNFSCDNMIALNGSDSCLKMMHNTNGLAFIPKFRIESYENRDELEFLSLPAEELSMNFVAVYPKDSTSISAGLGFKEFIKAML